jgi:hypothetical protein
MPRELHPSSVGSLEGINDSVEAIFLKVFTDVAGELPIKAVLLAGSEPLRLCVPGGRS